MGAVYLLSGDGGQTAVVKELDVGRMTSKERRQAALEVRLLSELSHPNIISYYGTVFNRKRQVLEIYMEYAPGGTLADVISTAQANPKPRGIDEGRVLRWTRQMLSALRTVHAQNIIHRDLKPSNVFLTQDGEAPARAPPGSSARQPPRAPGPNGRRVREVGGLWRVHAARQRRHARVHSVWHALLPVAGDGQRPALLHIN